MSFHLGAFNLISASGAVGFQNLNLIQDQVLTPFGTATAVTGFQLPRSMLLIGAAFVGSTGSGLLRGQLVTPSWRNIVLPDIVPVSTAIPAPRPSRFMDFSKYPTMLPAAELVQAAIGGATAAANIYGLTWVADQIAPPPAGDRYLLHGVSTSTASAGVWGALQVTWDQQIRAGLYSVVGSYHVSASAVAHRLMFGRTATIQQDDTLRPGNPSGSGTDQPIQCPNLDETFGEYGKFNSWVYPIFEALCDSADTQHDVWMQIVRIGELAGA